MTWVPGPPGLTSMSVQTGTAARQGCWCNSGVITCGVMCVLLRLQGVGLNFGHGVKLLQPGESASFRNALIGQAKEPTDLELA